ncbi:MAG TPA: formate/nitrite transporter family protein [Caulobacteraceae bacterium]|nr:formate/nitrite transporter family protein [Caulobacteraceae bacterium]
MPRPATQSPNLEPFQEEQAQVHAPLQPVVIHEIIRAEGESDLIKPASALLLSGLAAGLSMGFSYAGQALLKGALPQAPWAHAVASLGYAVGFAIVVLGRQQLFTESTLSAVLPTLTRRDARTATASLRLWSLVLLANIVGTWLFAAALVFLHPFGEAPQPAFATLAAESTAYGFLDTAVRGVFAGWLIAMMVWLLPTAGSARILIIALLTWLVAFGHLSHIIAGSSEGAFAVMTGAASFADYWLAFFIPTLLGNTIGGVALVALLNHAPISHKLTDA